MRALVTGAGGFIGGHVTRALAAAGAEVRAFDRRPPPDPPPGVEPVAADLLDAAALGRAIEGCDAVFHLAALYSYSRADAAATWPPMNPPAPVTRALKPGCAGRRPRAAPSPSRSGPSPMAPARPPR